MSDWDVSLVVMAIIAFVIYMLPGYIAYHRKHKRAEAIYALNFFFGWTGMVWFGLLFYASLGDTVSEQEKSNPK